MSYRVQTGGAKMVGLILIVTVMVVFDLAALRWGADSRPSIDNEPARNI